jgi:hypothetical protein
MNLDKLILKYLDGELSRSEDNELRRLLSEDIVAKETFDAHVLIHAAMKEDAKSIEPSAELVSKTEDKILTKILADQPIVGDIMPAKKRRKTFVYFSLVALFLLVSAISISEFSYIFRSCDLAQTLENERTRILHLSSLEQIGISNELIEEPETFAMGVPDDNNYSKKENKSLVSTQNRNVGEVEVFASGGSGAAVVHNDIRIVTYGGGTHIMETVSMDNVTANNINESTSAVSTMDKETNNLLADVTTVNNAVTSPVTDLYVLDNLKPVNLHPLKFANSTVATIENTTNVFGEQSENYFYGKRSDIKLTTFFGSSVFKGGFDENTPDILANFSQSLAYNISEDQQFGIDIGFTKYSYDQTKVVRTLGIINYESEFINIDGVEVKETGSSGNYIEAPITINTQYQTIWGAGFFDQCILNSNKFTLNGRVGLGGTSDGPLGYIRLYAKYNILKWLSLNVGTDGRMFRWSEPAFGANPGEFKSTISIIYGFEIKI